MNFEQSLVTFEWIAYEAKAKNLRHQLANSSCLEWFNLSRLMFFSHSRNSKQPNTQTRDRKNQLSEVQSINMRILSTFCRHSDFFSSSSHSCRVHVSFWLTLHNTIFHVLIVQLSWAKGFSWVKNQFFHPHTNQNYSQLTKSKRFCRHVHCEYFCRECYSKYLSSLLPSILWRLVPLRCQSCTRRNSSDQLAFPNEIEWRFHPRISQVIRSIPRTFACTARRMKCELPSRTSSQAGKVSAL